MEYVLLGKTGMRVSKCGLEVAAFGQNVGETGADVAMDRAYGAGIDFFDVDGREGDVTEEIAGRWMNGRRETVVLASNLRFPPIGTTAQRNSPRRHVLVAIESTLKRLRTDWIDVVYLHPSESEDDFEPSLEAVSDLIHQGKVMHCGLAGFPAWRAAKAVALSETRGLCRIAALKSEYSLLKRQAEVEIFPFARYERLPVCVSNSLAGRRLADDMGSAPESDSRGGLAGRLAAFAAERGLSPTALAVAWASSHPAAASILLDAQNHERFDEAIAGAGMVLTQEERAAISALSVAPPLATDR